MQWLWLIGAALAFAAFFGPSIRRASLRSKAVKDRAAQVMHGRDSLTPQQFADDFFSPSQRVTARGIHEILERVLICNTATIRPADALVADLGLGQVDGNDNQHLAADIEDRFGVDILTYFADRDPLRAGTDRVCRIEGDRLSRAQARSLLPINRMP